MKVLEILVSNRLLECLSINYLCVYGGRVHAQRVRVCNGIYRGTFNVKDT
jgi:hypothetical protein